MKFVRKTSEEWLSSEYSAPLFLCQLPFSVKEIERYLDITFDSVIEDGLGRVFYFFAQLENQELIFKGYLNKSNKGDLCVCVHMHSHEANPEKLIENILKLFEIERDSLLSFGEHLKAPQYSVSRLDDNNNEIEISRFHIEVHANFVKEMYEKRGHKQHYYVTKLSL